MGLDITAYSNLQPVGKCDLDWEYCDSLKHIRAYSHESFPQSIRGLKLYVTDDQFTQSGCFVKTSDTAKHGFRAGSYGGYNLWRSTLQNAFNPELAEDKPFYELIWFSDCEGVIGPDAASDLFEDFVIHDNQAMTLPDEVGYFYSRYQDWTRACLLAKRSGLIEFH